VNIYGAGCWFNNLKINKNATKQVTANDAIRIKGEMRIASGTFKTNGQLINVGP
jgi:hypothetical protein